MRYKTIGAEQQMKTEFEIKILDADVEAIVRLVTSLGATFVGEQIQKISIFEVVTPRPREYVRVRTDGLVTTLTHKASASGSIESREIEVVVDSYERSIELLEATGLKQSRTEEKIRARYRLFNCTVDIDTWPDVPTYVELESDSEASLATFCDRLGVPYRDCFRGSAHDVFRHYGLDPAKRVVMVFGPDSLNKLPQRFLAGNHPR